MSELQRAVDEFRRLLALRDSDASGQLTLAYLNSYKAIQGELQRLLRDIYAARLRGMTPTKAWLANAGRLQLIARQVEEQLAIFSEFASPTIENAQRATIADAQMASRAIIRARLGTPLGITYPPDYVKMNPNAVVSLVGKLQDGTPLKDLLDTLGPAASEHITKTLVSGLVQGKGMDAVASEVYDVLDITRSRALTIARTEIIGAYRESALDVYKQNSDIMDGWIWSAQLGPNSCAMCIAMSGKQFPLTVPFGSHPNCRCAPLPAVLSWDQLGFPGIDEPRLNVPTGAQWLEKQNERVQRRVLGTRQKFEWYDEGRMELGDLIGYKDDPTWGPSRYVLSDKAVADRLGIY